MELFGTSDILRNLIAKQHNGFLKSEMTRLSKEVSTGKDLSSLENNPSKLALNSSFRHSLNLLDTYQESLNLLASYGSARATALEKISSSVAGLGADMKARLPNGLEALTLTLDRVESAFEDSIGAINTSVGERYIFSGENSTNPPIVDADLIISELESVTFGISQAADLWNAIDQWFSQDGGGFDTFAYQGGAQNSSIVPISSTDSISPSTPANDIRLKETLRSLSAMIVVTNGSFQGTQEEKLALLETASSYLIADQSKLVFFGAEIGEFQSKIERARSQNSSEISSLEISVNNMTNVDLFESVTELEEVSNNLESLYLATARISRLNFSQYLR